MLLQALDAGPTVQSLGARMREHTPILHQEVNGRPLVYLDNAATSQKPRAVIDAMNEYYSAYNSNVHRGVHHLAALATTAYEGARAKVAGLINAPTDREIVFTRNASEAINLVAYSWGMEHLKQGDEVGGMAAAPPAASACVWSCCMERDARQQRTWMLQLQAPLHPSRAAAAAQRPRPCILPPHPSHMHPACTHRPQIILSVAEHHSNLVPWQLVAEKTGAVIKHVRLDEQQALDMQVRCSCCWEATGKLLGSLQHPGQLPRSYGRAMAAVAQGCCPRALSTPAARRLQHMLMDARACRGI
jgi:hypothetical protein